MTLAPIGAAMWLAHFGFHLLTALLTPIPVVQRLLLDLHFTFGGPPWWSLHAPAMPELLDLQCLVLDLGFLLSLYLAWKVSLDLARANRGKRLPHFYRGAFFSPCSIYVGFGLFFSRWRCAECFTNRYTL